MTDIKETCRKVKKLVDFHMVWTADDVVYDRTEFWISHADTLINNPPERSRTIKGDCDDFALTSAELLIHNGIDPAIIRIVYCEITGLGGHLICCVDDAEAKNTWVLDNNENDVVAWTTQDAKGYRYISGLRLSEKNDNIWRAIGG